MGWERMALAVGVAMTQVPGLARGGESKLRDAVRAVAAVGVLRAAMRSGRWVRAIVSLVLLMRFTPKKGLPALGLVEMALRRALFGKVNLPPFVSVDLVARKLVQVGWQNRHKMSASMEEELNTRIICVPRPFSHTDWRPMVPIVFASDPEMVKKVLSDKKTFPTRGYTGFTSFTGQGLLGLPTNDMWKRHRTLITKNLSDKHLRAYAEITQRKLDILVGKWSAAAKMDEQVDGYYDMSMLTLDVIMEITTGDRTAASNQEIPENENENAHNLDYALAEIVARTAAPVYDWLPYPAKLLKIFEHGDQKMKDLMDKAASPQAPPSIARDLLLLEKAEGSRALTRAEISSELTTIRGAGHETTGNTVCFMMLLLSQNPRVLEKLREEVDRVVKGDHPTFDEWKQMPYAEMVMYEALRMFPTVPQFPREAAVDTKLGEYDIPKGSLVFVNQQSLNYDPEIWENPHEFRPERFENVRELRPTEPVGVPNKPELAYGYVPFGAAHRTCVGQRLAMLEGVQIISSIVKNFDLQVTKPVDDIPLCCDVTLGPKYGLPLKIKRRTMK